MTRADGDGESVPIPVPRRLFWGFICGMPLATFLGTWYVATKDHEGSTLALTVAKLQEGAEKDREAQAAVNAAIMAKIDAIVLHVERIDSQVGFLVTFFEGARGAKRPEHYAP